jgi:GNAT superfamily N-acetyltransferase
MTLDLDLLYQHEAAYYSFSSHLEKSDCCWYLSCPDLPESREVNRALRLRDDGRGPQAVAREVVSHFRAAGTRVTAEIDAVSESQGIGFALRRMGITHVLQSRSLMRFTQATAVNFPPNIEVVELKPDSDYSQINVWIETNLHELDIYEHSNMWRALAQREAASTYIRLFLGYWNGAPAGTCSLFQADGMGRIEMVETRTEYRRRGIASAIVARAATESVRSGDAVTYLFTDRGGDAERLYTKLGFVGESVDIMRRHIEN